MIAGIRSGVSTAIVAARQHEPSAAVRSAGRIARSRQRRKPATKKINIALQGGGSHGAFAWGVLDRLLDDERLTIDGIVGTSAGAMNAAVTAYGLATGGPQGAKAKLRDFALA